MSGTMRPYVVILHMKNGDVIVRMGYAHSSVEAQDLAEKEYRHHPGAWHDDVHKVHVSGIRSHKHPGMTHMFQVAWKERESL
jgi:hypothetical protein